MARARTWASLAAVWSPATCRVPCPLEKKVEAGHLLETRYGRIAYNDIGTFSGTSGAPILNGITGEIAGVHIKGGALPVGGFNSGTAIGAIRAKSKALANL